MNLSKLAAPTLALSTSILAGLFMIYHKNINTENLYLKETNIHTIHDLKSFEKELTLTDKDSLVVFDVSKVIFVKKDSWERGYKKERLAAKTINSLHNEGSELFTTIDPKTREQLWLIHKSANEDTLLCDKICTIIKMLQQQSVKTIALTRYLVGKTADASYLQHSRINKLLTHGIDFSNSFPSTEKIKFKQFEFEKRYPAFEKGILFTSYAVSKGKLLKVFFEKINWHPTKVIMIDDRIQNLKSVQEELQPLGIPFVGFEYKAAEKLPAFFDKEIAEFQMTYLIENKIWLSASEAALRLNKQHIMQNQPLNL